MNAFKNYVPCLHKGIGLLSTNNMVKSPPENPLVEDLDHILEHTALLFEDLREQRIFITGGTGFFGSWLLESFIWINRKLALNASVVVLTRNANLFRSKCPHIATNPAIEFIEGDVRSFNFPQGKFQYVIHAATESSTQLNERDPALMLDTVIEGMRRVLKFASQASCAHFLFTSSGAIYGNQPSTISHMPEDYNQIPDQLHRTSAYAEGKRAAELLGVNAASEHNMAFKIARCYAFVGPYLPLNAHFAIGNFIRDGMQGGPIKIKGDGTPRRSYLYASDLIIFLWTILFKGQSSRAYNVGSENDHSIFEIAKAVAAEFSPLPKIEIAQKPNPSIAPSYYVPSTARAQKELGLFECIPLSDAITKTIAWHKLISTTSHQY